MDSFSSPSSGSSHQLSADDLRKQLKNQLAMEYAQQFLEWEENVLRSVSRNQVRVLVEVKAVASLGKKGRQQEPSYTWSD
ncbi:unnamed protein product [Sphenostylis stenocarpa]|uniref:Uncharacterized protein n=1 Tax=Sphenostylis stenocarpa TaxID=92480 RepID=A0AA86SM92_9FABA|nr:unnamed protein product [Sphenostylis stenocarpa]